MALMMHPKEKRTAGIIGVAVVNAVLAAYFVPLAIGNLFTGPGVAPPLFHYFYIALSLATPAFLIASAVCLVVDLIHTHPILWRIATFSKRLAFWTLVLRAVALIGLSLVIPNESLSATIPFVTGVVYLLLALIAGAACTFLGK